MGCYWILDVLEDLLKKARESFWVGGDRLRMIRLLGRNPVDAVDDPRVAEVFAASHALRPVGNAFAELEADMSELAVENKEKEIRARWRKPWRKGDPEKARQSLIDLVQGEIERVEAIAAEHEENAGEDAVRMRALKGFVFTPKAEAMRRWFARAKGSVERGGKVLRQEIRARKADGDSQGLPPVPGKDISPYDGRPASWWRESAGKDGGRRAENGGRRTEDGGPVGLGQGREGDCGSGGALADDGSDAAVEVGRETQAGGTRSVPATSNEKGRGWDSVVVEDSDILACGGYLPEKYVGAASDGGREDEAPAAAAAAAAVEDEVAAADALQDEVPTLGTVGSELEVAKQCDMNLNTGGVSEVTQHGMAEDGEPGCDEQVGDHAGEGSALVVRECPPTAACGGIYPTRGEGNAPNEPNFGADVCIAQHQEIIEVPTNSGGVSGLDGCQTNPILQTKPIPIPIPEGGAEAGGVGGSTPSVGRALTDNDRRDAWKEARRREWHRARAEKEERERLVKLNSGVAGGGVSAGDTAGEAMGSQDVRGP